MISGEFSKLYKKLNGRQKEAVDAIDGPVMVIAGPGTGKTTILTLRIAKILEETDTPPHGILALTYTDAGVKAMRDKLKKIIGNRAHDVNIHTFHSFASSIIAEYPDHFINLQGMEQMTEIEQETIIKTILSDVLFAKIRPSGKPDAYVSSIIRAIDDAKREALTPKMILQYAKDEIKRIKKDENSISTRGITKGKLKAEALLLVEKCERTVIFAKVYERYEEKKREAELMDFNDLIIELLIALRNDELLLRLIQERFLYIHVDEHQDTNDAQNLIIALIAEFFETPNIFIVGDEKQAIYRFQGASVENFMLLQKRWPAMKVISLDKNYRSHQSILDASFKMIEENYLDDEHKNLRVKLESALTEKKQPIEIITAQNSSAGDFYLTDEVRKIIKTEPKSTIAVIVRRNRELDRIIRLFESENISVSSERSVDIFSHPVGRLFFDFLEYLNDDTKIDALGKTLVASMWNISFEKGVQLSRELRSGQNVDFKKELPALFEIKTEMLGDSPVNFLINAAKKSGFSKLVAKDPSHVHVWRGIVALSESLTREGKFSDPTKLIETILAYRASAESRPVKVTVGAPDVSLQALTAHGSKGLEFDYVFLPYATEEMWVGKPKGSSFILPKKQTSENDIRDTRRLFYVALTRARKHAVIITPLEESDGKTLTSLRFIAELDKNHVITKTLPRAGAEELEKREIRPSEDIRKSKIIDIAKHYLLEEGLSTTALNHFLECPNKFIYQSVLKIPQALSLPAEKGNAMHYAMAKIWKNENRDFKNLELLILQSTNAYLDKSFLPNVEKERARSDLHESAGDVAKALVSHFSQKGNIFTEYKIKETLQVARGENLLSIPIHGRLDAILENDNEIFVFDYKTKQAMSISAIKGETKNDDGNYFRQLVFYKILLGQNPKWRNKKITPALVFISPDKKKRCPTVSLPITDGDIARVKEEIQSLVDFVWSGKIGDAKCDDYKCEWCGMRNL